MAFRLETVPEGRPLSGPKPKLFPALSDAKNVPFEKSL